MKTRRSPFHLINKPVIFLLSLFVLSFPGPAAAQGTVPSETAAAQGTVPSETAAVQETAPSETAAAQESVSSETAEAGEVLPPLTIDQVQYTLPAPVSTLISSGFECGTEEPLILEPGYYETAVPFYKGDLTVFTLIANTGRETASVENCTLAGLFLDSVQMEDAPGTQAFLGGGLSFDTMPDDIETILGPASEISSGEDEDDSSIRYIYRYGLRRRLAVSVDTEDRKITQIDLIDLPDASVSPVTAGNASSVKAEDYTVTCGGVQYTLPAKVSDFLENGWTIREDRSASVIPAGGFDRVCLYMPAGQDDRENGIEDAADEEEILSVAVNYSGTEAGIRDCYITFLSGDSENNPVGLILPDNITYDTKEEELSPAYVLDGEDEDQRIYLLEDPDNILNYRKVTVKKETSQVCALEVSCVPDFLPAP